MLETPTSNIFDIKWGSIHIDYNNIASPPYFFSENYFATCITSPHYVLENIYPTTTKIVMPNGINKIGDFSFTECTNLKSIEMPDSVINIGIVAFTGCTKLSHIKLSNNINKINLQMFDSCTSLTSIEIPNNVTSIANYAFANCTNLTTIEIPDSVTTIETNAFNNVPHITYNGTATGSPWGALSIN